MTALSPTPNLESRFCESSITNPKSRLQDRIREHGPLTVAAFMELALYHPEAGYYGRAAQRSGRAGDFFTSVDVGPIFGELLEIQLAEMSSLLLDSPGSESRIPNPESQVDLVEAGAGNGRLSADILRASRRRDSAFYNRIRLHLVEASQAARAAQTAALGDVVDRLASSSDSLPGSFEGILIANELLDAMPVHQVVMREGGLREVYVDVGARESLRTTEGPPSTPALGEYLERLGVVLEPGWRVEINLAAVEWIRTAARRLRRGFIILIDYGHQARELYSVSHAAGTLTTFDRHTSAGPEQPGEVPVWLERPGEQDITAHVDFTSVQQAAQAEGLTTLGFLDQTYFLMGLLQKGGPESFLEKVPKKDSRPHFYNSLKTLLLPGGLGSTHKVMIFGKEVGTPALSGCSYRMRVT